MFANAANPYVSSWFQSHEGFIENRVSIIFRGKMNYMAYYDGVKLPFRQILLYGVGLDSLHFKIRYNFCKLRSHTIHFRGINGTIINSNHFHAVKGKKQAGTAVAHAY